MNKWSLLFAIIWLQQRKAHLPAPGLGLEEPLSIQLCQHIHPVETLSWLTHWVCFVLGFFYYFFANWAAGWHQLNGKKPKSSGSCFAVLGKAGSDPVWLYQQNTGLHLSCRGKCLFCRFSCRIGNHFPAIMCRSGIYRKVELIHERSWEGDLHNQGTRHFSIINALNGQICCMLTESPGKK